MPKKHSTNNLIQFPGVERDTKEREPLRSERADRINIVEYLIKHPKHTAFATAEGDGFESEGIFDGDLLVLDSLILAERGDVIAVNDEGSPLLRIAKYNGEPAGAIVTHVIRTIRKEQGKQQARR